MGVPFLDNFFESTSKNIGVPDDQIRFIGAIILSVPLSFLFRLLNNAFLRYLIGALLGFLFQFIVYSEGIISTIAQCIITYVMVLIFKEKCGKLVFIQNIVYMSAHHIYRQIYDYGSWRMDITLILMMLVCKFTSFAYCCEDGFKSADKLSKDQEAKKIEKIPNFFQYISYIYFFPSSVTGTSFDFRDYQNFIEREGRFKKIPNSLIPSLQYVGLSIVFLLTTLFLLPRFPIPYCADESFSERSLLYRIYYFNVAITLCRFRYYVAWCMAQAGINGCGLSFNGYDKETKQPSFDGVLSANPVLEVYYSPREKIEKWNASVQVWLRNYVYFRIFSEEEIKKSNAKKEKANNVTFLVSALWHGFYPAYYISFLHWGFINTISQYCYKASVNNPKFPYYNNILYKIIRFIAPNMFLNYFGIIFQLLSFNASWMFLKNTYFFGPIIVYFGMAFFTITKFGQRSLRPSSDKPTPNERAKKE